ncbi:hypothetical protein SAY86_024686 [Trapa natans]|uniref:glucan endo-1,3-beta-D-glucosidase n=1 Tax=Trapa natans TaxID=22666 RepID=A0AAN7RI98_TRANT|nr:hypothetical protein SAY86_024686 [Trapa natans]
MLTDTYPPSKATFNLNQDSLVTPIIDFLLENQAPLLANIYPYFAYSGNTAQVALNYALFTAKDSVVNDGQLNYQNLFDAMLDSVYNALEKKNAGSVKVVVSESGWPTGGGVGASVDNAETYNSKLVRHVKGGTPKRQNQAIETYIFAMFDENQKTGDPVERFWGLFQPVQKKLKYAMEFS